MSQLDFVQGSYSGPLRIGYSFYYFEGTILDPQVYFGIQSTTITSVSG